MSVRCRGIDPATADKLRALTTQLSDRDGLRRREARRELELMGTMIGPYLIRALSSKDVHARWEAAKALGAVTIPTAAPALVNALMDGSFEVQWLAAEALINLGERAVVPLLEGLVEHPASLRLRQGAHHVLSDLERRDLLDDSTREVIEEVSSITPREPYPIAARRALGKLSRSAAKPRDSKQTARPANAATR